MKDQKEGRKKGRKQKNQTKLAAAAVKGAQKNQQTGETAHNRGTTSSEFQEAAINCSFQNPLHRRHQMDRHQRPVLQRVAGLPCLRDMITNQKLSMSRLRLCGLTDAHTVNVSARV